MGCPSEVVIGDNLIFSIATHDADTGILTDAASDPTYRIYEDETATPILTGTMAKLDDANTTGFYTESIACTAANGFENGKTYTIYIEATVDGDTGGISYGFKATDQTGYKLASNGLDQISASEPSAKPTTFAGWIMWLVQRFRKASKSPTTITVQTEAGATVTTQAITDDGEGTETLGAPT